MGRFGEQLIKKTDGKPPDLVDVGMEAFLRAHKFHAAGADMLGSTTLESATYHSADISMQNAANPDMSDRKAVDILDRERTDIERADELARRIRSGEIGEKKKRPIIAEGGREQ